MENIDIIITRHPALVAYLIEISLATADTPVLAHASISDVKGKHVVGVLPHHLSQHTASITEIPMSLDIHDREAMQRGDLSLERVRAVAGYPVTYEVFGGSIQTRSSAIARASDRQSCLGWSKKRLEALLCLRLAKYALGTELWCGTVVTTPEAVLCATAIDFAGQQTETGPIFGRNHQLRSGYALDAPTVPMTGLHAWSGDGSHGGSEVDLDGLRIRAYGSGPEWTDWVSVAPSGAGEDR